MKNYLKEILLIVVGLLTLIVIVCFYWNPIDFPYGISCDAKEYWHLSSNIKEGKGFILSDISVYPSMELDAIEAQGYPIGPFPVTYRVPVYPYVLSVIRSIHDSYIAAIIFNILCYLGLCIYGVLIGRIFFLKKTVLRWIYNFLIVFNPIYLTRWGVGSDISGAFFAVAFTYHILKLNINSDKSSWHVISTCVFGLMAQFTRANLLIYTFPLTFLTILRGIWRKNIKLFLKAVFVLSVFVLVTLGWIVRTHKINGQWGISAQSGFVLYKVQILFNTQKDDPLRYWYQQGPKELFIKNYLAGKTFNENEAIIDKKLKEIVIQHYKSQPLLFVKNWIEGVRTFFMFSYTELSKVIGYIVSRIFKTPGIRTSIENVLYPINRFYRIFIGASFLFFMPVFLLKRSNFKKENFDLIIILYLSTLCEVLMTSLFTGAGARMRMPFIACIILFVLIFWECFKSPWIWTKNK